MKRSKPSARVIPVALAGRDLGAVSGGIWGGPDGTWTCTPGVLDPWRLQRRRQAKAETTPVDE